MHKFQQSYQKAKKYEKIILEYLKTQDYIKKVYEASKNLQIEYGIDYIVVFNNEAEARYELKTDFWTHKTGNVVYEESVVYDPECELMIPKTKPGWTHKSQTDILIYWAKKDGAYFFDWPEIKRKWIELGKKGERKTIYNYGWHGNIGLFPLDFIKEQAILYVPENDLLLN
jgi:hypothetical protein